VKGRHLLHLFAVVIFAGCHTGKAVPASPEASHVQLVKAVGAHCHQLGDIFGTASSGSQEVANRDARNDLRNKAHATGATHVELQGTSSARVPGPMRRDELIEITVAGVAYDCNPRSNASPGASDDPPEAPRPT